MKCPMMSKEGSLVECMGKECSIWMELFEKDAKGEQVKDAEGNPKKEGKCGHVWTSILQIESMNILINMNKTLKEIRDKK